MHRWSVALAGVAVSGCVSVGARVQASPTLSTRGEVGGEVMASVRFGIALGARTSLATGATGRTGRLADASFSVEQEVYRMGERWSGWGGFSVELATTGRAIPVAGFAAVARTLRYRERDRCGGGWGLCTGFRHALSLGAEGRVGLLEVGETAGDDRGALFSVGPVLDWTAIVHTR